MAKESEFKRPPKLLSVSLLLTSSSERPAYLGTSQPFMSPSGGCKRAADRCWDQNHAG